MKKFGIFFLKLIIVGGLFGFLFWRAATETNENGQNVFALLWEQPKRWDLLIASFLVQACAASLTFIRWRWLVRAFGLKLSHYDAQRLGFLGLFINLTPLGIVGGDAAKAFFLAGKNDVNCRPQAFASVIVDRMVGLLMMFLFASVTSLLTGFAFQKNVLTQTITYTVFALTPIAVDFFKSGICTSGG
ncbi:hypothetical protein FACS189419_09840 [Planctomycetales bacterium]|nr:hypothetical protein FACS189419_09840 [Planctomycetales bacterium]